MHEVVDRVADGAREDAEARVEPRGLHDPQHRQDQDPLSACQQTRVSMSASGQQSSHARQQSVDSRHRGLHDPQHREDQDPLRPSACQQTRVKMSAIGQHVSKRASECQQLVSSQHTRVGSQ